ncbi:uncharacterized protein K02A2.6-like [Dendronephthya gigantea]|uniref:uncharacterized protein K02A2.6-like n=1 Tax=Dendronephthya gigantea TaxID=151771 RepID=UPI001069A970|nr:uncharacterized protein K02A2.6-like [Dendronephthya gigantea]
MTKELTDYILRCPTCNAYPQDQQKEPLICHAIPERPWEKVGCDLFEYDESDFLLTVDYFSNFFELYQLRSKTSDKVIGELKSHFSRYGVPDQLITDNGPPYNSGVFCEFAREFEFEHITSSPGYPKSNGKSENAVRTAKRLMKKAKESGRDLDQPKESTAPFDAHPPESETSTTRNIEQQPRENPVIVQCSGQPNEEIEKVLEEQHTAAKTTEVISDGLLRTRSGRIV